MRRAVFITRVAYSASGYLRNDISFTLKTTSPAFNSVEAKIDFGLIAFTNNVLSRTSSSNPTIDDF